MAIKAYLQGKEEASQFLIEIKVEAEFIGNYCFTAEQLDTASTVQAEINIDGRAFKFNAEVISYGDEVICVAAEFLAKNAAINIPHNKVILFK